MRPANIAGCLILVLSGVVAGQADSKDSPFSRIVKEMLGVMDKLTGSLSTIKDEESAKAAKPELRKAANEFVEIRKKSAKLKPPSTEESEKLRKEYKEKLEKANKKLLGEIARVKGVPGGIDALKEISALLLDVKKGKQ